MRFNPPPNWPPPPPGWVPGSGWAPDPSWPPAPPGWQFWVDDSAPGIPPGYPPGYPQWPGQPPRQGRPGWRKALWVTIAAATLAVTVLAAIFVAGPGHRSATGAEKPSKKPNITELTRDLLVDKSAFPDIVGGKRKSGLGGNDRQSSGTSNFSINPEECSEFYGYAESATQTAYATVSTVDANGPSSLEVHLAILPEQPDLRGRLGKCQSFTVSLELLGRTLTFDAQLEPLETSGVPPWAVGTVMKSSSTPFPGIPISVSMTTATISAYYRGVLVVAGYDVFNRRKNNAAIPADGVADLVRLFDAQIEKLEAAP